MHRIAIPYCQCSQSAKCSDRISDWDSEMGDGQSEGAGMGGREGGDNKLRHYPITIIAASYGIVLFVVYVWLCCSSCTHLVGSNNGIVILKPAPQTHTHTQTHLCINRKSWWWALWFWNYMQKKRPSPEMKAHPRMASGKIEVTTMKYILCAFNVLAELRRIHSPSLRFRAPHIPNASKLYQDNVCFIDK